MTWTAGSTSPPATPTATATTDVEGGRQQIQVGQINNEQGVHRDVAEGNRKTQDFNATTGALNSATGQVGNAAQLTLAQVKAMTDADLQQLVARGNAAAAAELARRQAQSGAAALGEKVIGAAGGKPPIPGGG
jgi:conjugal transfer/entry exclusion protein